MAKSLFNLLIVLFPIFSIYGFSPALDLGSILIFITGTFCFLTKVSSTNLTLPDGYKCFFYVAIILGLLFIKTIPLRLILFTINLYFACKYIDINKFIFYYNKTVYFCCLFFIIQELTYCLFNERISGIVNFIPTIYGDNTDKIIDQVINGSRSPSFFSEPSYLAQYIFPYIIIKMNSINKKDIQKGILASLVILLTFSGTGIFLLFIIWIIWFLFSNIKFAIKFTTAFICILGVLIILIYDNSIFDSLLNRSVELQSYEGDEEYISSGFIRFFRGYFLYEELPLTNKLLGSSNTLIASLMNENIYFMGKEKFLNGVQTLLIYNGLLVCILYFRHLILFYKKSPNSLMLAMIICYLFLMIGESYYLSSRSFIVILILCGITNNSLNLKNKQITQLKY